MEAKTEESYTAVLQKCKILFPSLQPLTIMTDFEMGLQNAFKAIYPEAILHGCWFHYVQVPIIYFYYVKRKMITKTMKKHILNNIRIPCFYFLQLYTIIFIPEFG